MLFCTFGTSKGEILSSCTRRRTRENSFSRTPHNYDKLPHIKLETSKDHLWEMFCSSDYETSFSPADAAASAGQGSRSCARTAANRITVR